MGYDSSLTYRKKIAAANGISNYTGTADQNIQMLDLLKAGKLRLPDETGTEAEPATVTLDTSSATVQVGNTVQINASFTQGTATWTSSNASVASITVVDDSTVSVKAVGMGSATITCTLSNGNSASCTITAVATATVTLSTAAATVPMGNSIHVTAYFDQGTVSWSSGSIDVATITVVDQKTASIRAVGPGTTIVTCTLSNGYSATCVITVDDVNYFPACSASATSFGGALLEQGFDASEETRTKIAVANDIADYSGAEEEDQALLALMKAGKLVNPGIIPAEGDPVAVALSQTTASMSVGQKLQLVAFFSEGSVYWKSSNVNVLTIKEVGTDRVLLTAVGEGKATITCVLDDGSYAKCVVRTKFDYFDVCASGETSLDNALDEQNYDVTPELKAAIAEANGIADYADTTQQNQELLNLMRAGKLINPGLMDRVESGLYFEKCDASFESIALALESVGVDSSKTNREQIAVANGIENYTGTANQNTQMLNLMKAGKLRKPDIILNEGEFLVQFHANGGNGEMEKMGLTSGSRLPANVLTQKGYTFAGWATSETGDVVYADGADQLHRLGYVRFGGYPGRFGSGAGYQWQLQRVGACPFQY